MLKKPCKQIKQDNGTINIYGNYHWIELEYHKPEWSEYEETCFMYKGNRHYLCNFIKCEGLGFFKDFDGYESDSFFSGVLVKYHEYEDAVQAFTYIS